MTKVHVTRPDGNILVIDKELTTGDLRESQIDEFLKRNRSAAPARGPTGRQAVIRGTLPQYPSPAPKMASSGPGTMNLGPQARRESAEKELLRKITSSESYRLAKNDAMQKGPNGEDADPAALDGVRQVAAKEALNRADRPTDPRLILAAQRRQKELENTQALKIAKAQELATRNTGAMSHLRGSTLEPDVGGRVVAIKQRDATRNRNMANRVKLHDYDRDEPAAPARTGPTFMASIADLTPAQRASMIKGPKKLYMRGSQHYDEPVPSEAFPAEVAKWRASKQPSPLEPRVAAAEAALTRRKPIFDFGLKAPGDGAILQRPPASAPTAPEVAVPVEEQKTLEGARARTALREAEGRQRVQAGIAARRADTPGNRYAALLEADHKRKLELAKAQQRPSILDGLTPAQRKAIIDADIQAGQPAK